MHAAPERGLQGPGRTSRQAIAPGAPPATMMNIWSFIQGDILDNLMEPLMHIAHQTPAFATLMGKVAHA